MTTLNTKILTVRASASVALGALLLAGCSQAPAPVVDGYGNNRDSFAASQAQIQQNYQKYGSFTDRVSNQNADRVSHGTMGGTDGSKIQTQTAGLDKPLLPPSSISMQEENLAAIQPASGTAPTLEKPVLIKPVHGKPLTTTVDLQDVRKPLVETATAATDKPTRYTVQPGDGIYPLARRFNVTPAALFAANNLPTNAGLTAGQVLVIPQKGITAKQAANATPVISKMSGKMSGATPTTESQLQARLDSATAGAQAATVQASTPASAPAYVNHTVAAGETIFRISRQYHASVIDIMAANDMQTPQQLQSGMVVKVPVGHGKSTLAAQNTATPVKGNKPVQVADNDSSAQRDITTTSHDDDGKDDGTASSEDDDKDSDNLVRAPKPLTATDKAKAEQLRGHVDALAARANGLAWPVQGQVIRKFGEQGNGVMQSGINIAVPENTPVLATQQGTVIYAGNGLRSYGDIVLLRHPDGMVSAYAHNNQLLVTKGDTVKKGQVIALSGATGNVDKPQLHFEIRQAARAVDPMRMLAAR